MKPSSLYFFQILTAIVCAESIALPYGIRLKTKNNQQHLMDPVGPVVPPSPHQPAAEPERPPPQGGVLISDVMGRDRSINIFAGLTRDIASISARLDDSSKNSTVLAPRNSAVENLPRKPWEDPKDYDALGANAYEGEDGQGRAQRNLRRFVEAHVVPASPWAEGEKIKTLLDGDREIWWETKDGVKVIQPDGIEVDSVASRVGNGELWILKGVRNYA
ncbi:Transcriptional regulatory protein sin3 [Hypoxylon texense]